MWVKDGIYINNGPAPEGFTLSLDSQLVDKLTRITNSVPGLDGLYHCEVWGSQPYQRILSRKALVKVKGKKGKLMEIIYILPVHDKTVTQ